MNKSVLIVICDFLLLSLLSLANFDNIQTEDAAATAAKEEANRTVFYRLANARPSKNVFGQRKGPPPSP